MYEDKNGYLYIGLFYKEDL
ncbi:hypothetical protein [Paraclostridium sp. AKS81]|nr:hypothetical protein [Paraclostridium sp. AKS81]